MKSRNRLIFWAVLVLLGCSPPALGCQCVDYKPPCAAFKETTVVFVGTVRDIGEATKEEQGRSYPFNDTRAHFHVEEALKGLSNAEVDVYTSSQGTACGFPFEVGQTYLVYAYRIESKDDQDTPQPNQPPPILGTSICTRTRLAVQVQDEIKVLRSLATGKLRPIIYGTVKELMGGIFPLPLREERPRAGITVIAQNGTTRLEAVTDDEGHFSFTDLKQGRYRLHLVLPPTYKLGGDAWEDDTRSLPDNSEVEINNKGCPDEIEILMRVDGRVRGRVYDAQGRPARKGVRVTLISPDKAITYKTGYYAPTENEKEHISVETNEQGYYEFKGVPPGKYLLGINLSNQPYRYNPYPQTYFPEGGDARRATVIILTAGQKLSGYDLHLPPRLVERIIKGMVKYQNGSPAIGAEVYVSDAEEFKRAKTDSRGEFEVKCLDGLTYSFQASLRDKDYTLMAESAKVEVKVMKDTPPLLLKFESK